ncbi:mobile element protein [Vibrio sp. JCM 18904]|nr:mobile element protein [Vibrio sp. JCM 18904]
MTTKKTRIKHAPEFKAESLKLQIKSVSLLRHDSYRYMNLKSMDGVKPLKKTRKSVIEKEN